jgi:hypothetical protein
LGKRVEEWSERAWKALIAADCALYEALQASDGPLRRHLAVCHAEHLRAMGDLAEYKAEWRLAWTFGRIGSQIRIREDGYPTEERGSLGK